MRRGLWFALRISPFGLRSFSASGLRHVLGPLGLLLPSEKLVVFCGWRTWHVFPRREGCGWGSLLDRLNRPGTKSARSSFKLLHPTGHGILMIFPHVFLNRIRSQGHKDLFGQLRICFAEVWGDNGAPGLGLRLHRSLLSTVSKTLSKRTTVNDG